jgi:hypothetical protein
VSKQENQRYLRRLWAGVLLLVLIGLGLMVWSTWRSWRPDALTDPSQLIVHAIPLAFVACALIVAWWSAQRLAKAMASALRAPTPEPFLALLDKSLKSARIADMDAFAAQSRAVVLALYGEGPRALALLEPIDWQRRAPLVQAAGVVSESLVALLCDGDFERGLRDARRARSLAQIARSMPGSRTSDRFYSTVVALAQVLAGEEDASTVPTLEDAAKAKTLPTLKAIALAGLTAEALRSGPDDRAKALRSELASFAPALDKRLFG